MIKISNEKIIESVYNLCVQANTLYPFDLYSKLSEKYLNIKTPDAKQRYQNIMNNICVAAKTKRPLCQDTGQVIVFLQIGQCFSFESDINDSVNIAVERAYKENYFRKSVVKNTLFDRNNTNNNTPAIIYTELNDSNQIKIDVLIKGAGSENYSCVKMFKPTCNRFEIFDFIKNELKNAGEKACPPFVLGIGAGGTMDTAAILSKKSFFNKENSNDEKRFIDDLKAYLCDSVDILDIKLKTTATHIACLPIGLTINCHSCRHASCVICEDSIIYDTVDQKFNLIEEPNCNELEVSTNDIEKIKSLNVGDHILLSGEIFTARDAAHEKFAKIVKSGEELPIDLKDKIIFYAGPCPSAPDEIIGPIGPTTSARMDSFCDLVYGRGLVATIGKGERSEAAICSIKKYGGRYFSVQGGIACLLSSCVKKSEVVAFDELGTEAVRKLVVEKLPVFVEV